MIIQIEIGCFFLKTEFFYIIIIDSSIIYCSVLFLRNGVFLQIVKASALL